MAGSNPGMVIKVAGDITEAQAAFREVAASAGTTADAVNAIGGAYTHLGNVGPSELNKVKDATNDVNAATGEVSTSMLALGVGIGVIAAEAVGALIRLGVDGVQAVASEVWSLIDAALGLHDAWSDFENDVTVSIQQSGVLKAGVDTLITSLEVAFGVNRQGAIRIVTGLINESAVAVLGLAQNFLTLAEWGGRSVGLLMGPLDALTVSINYAVTGILDGIVRAREAIAGLPGVGAEYDAETAKIRDYANSWREVRDRTEAAMHARDDMVHGQGAFMDGIGKIKGAIDDARQAMIQQQGAAAAATTDVNALATANAGLVEGAGQAAVMLYTQNEQLAAMDKWSRSIKDQKPLGVLLENLDKTKPKFIDTQETMDAWSRNIKNLDDANPFGVLLHNLKSVPPTLDAGTKAMIDAAEAAAHMGDEATNAGEKARFAAETVQKMALTWDEAMQLVREGKGTMSGTIQAAPGWTPPAFDWRHAVTPADMSMNMMVGSMPSWMQGPVYGGTIRDYSGDQWRYSTVQNVTVNTVAGDKHAIAAVVKDALADDWKTQGRKG